MTPYEVLGLTTRATAKEVTTKYKILAQIYHPDRFVTAPKPVRLEAERLMAELNEAYALARRGFNGHMGGSSGAGPAPPPGRGSSFRPPPPAPPWHEQVRERAAQARRATEAKRARQRMANNGQARAQPKDRSGPRSMLFGMGEARHTGNITCRNCRSVQWLPAGWEQRLDDVNYYCSFCSEVLLAR